DEGTMANSRAKRPAGERRNLFLIAVMLAAALGCGKANQTPPGSPETFRADVEFLIEAGDYRRAVARLESTDHADLAAYDQTGYLAVGEDMIVLPGVDPKIIFEADRDWFIPGTSDVVEDMKWQRAATEF